MPDGGEFVPGYDALLIVGFGGPERREDVMPFLENVTRGRNVPRERLLGVAEHYDHFGGKSPINDQVRALIAALEPELARRRSRAAHLLGQPQLASVPGRHDAADDRGGREAGARSRAGRVQLLFELQAVPGRHRPRKAAVGAGAPAIDKIRVFYNHPGFISANVDHLKAALAADSSRPSRVRPRRVYRP